MVWLNPWLLAGLAATVLPLIIHLAMRRRPRAVSFPPAALVRQSSASSSGRTRLRHLLLMFLRMALLALLVLIVARPIEPQKTDAMVAAEAPAAVVLCFDNSASMGWTLGGRTRLDEAIDQARTILDRLPPGSRAAVIDLNSAGLVTQLQSELALARRDLQAVQLSAVSRPVSRLIRSAAALLREAGEVRREIYLFSDLQPAATADLKPAAFADLGNLAVCFIDLSPQEGRNAALELPDVSSSIAAVGSKVAIAVEAAGDERPTRRTVLLERDGQVRDRRQVAFDTPFARSLVEFVEPVERLGPLQGRVLIDEPDALAADNARYFTLHAAEPPRVLLAGQRNRRGNQRSTAQLIAQALSPDDFAHRPPVEVKLIEPADLKSEPLAACEAVFLCDAASLPAEALDRLDDYVRAGGHLVVVAGPAMAASIAAGPASPYRSSRMTQLLGAEFGDVSLWNAGSSLSALDWQAPALAPFDGGRKGDLGMPVIYRAISLRPAPQTQIVLTVADRQPALICSARGTGRVHLLATGLDASWSNLPARPYEFVPLMHALVAAGRAGLASAHQIGEPINYVFPRQLAGLEAVLTGPDLPGPIRRTITPGAAAAQFPPLLSPGNYEIRVRREGRDHLFGFSLNINPDESQRQTADRQALSSAFAEGGLTVCRTLSETPLRVAAVARRREWSAWLLPLLIVLLLAELLLANRFYRRKIALNH